MEEGRILRVTTGQETDAVIKDKCYEITLEGSEDVPALRRNQESR